MRIELISINIENFKGVKAFKFTPDGENACITAQNGTGKTTVYDAFLFLLFGKDSTGRKDFEIRPLNANNQPINGLTLAVEAVLGIDGETHTFRKEQHEKYIKDKMTGFETLCYVDEVPKKVGEYNEYIAEIISEDAFKALTDLTYFNNLHWTKRRALLLEIAGEIGTPKGFDELLGKLNGRSIEDYKKVLANQQTRLKKDRDEIPSRIDEIQRGLGNYAEEYSGVTAILEKQRTDVTAKIAKIDGMRQNVFAQEKERQTKINTLNTLQAKRIKREGELANDTSGITNLLNEKAEIEKDVANKKQAVASAESKAKIQQAVLTGRQGELVRFTQNRADILEEMKRVAAADLGVKAEPESDTCPFCEQKLPAKKLAAAKKKIQDAISAAEARKQSQLDGIMRRGNEAKKTIDLIQQSVETLTAELTASNTALQIAQVALTTAESVKAKRFAEIDELIKGNPKPKLEDDKIWEDIIRSIVKIEAEIGEPVSEQLQALDNRRTLLNNELAEVNKALADADNAKKAKARIIELGEQEKKLAQQLADIERLLAMIGDYTQKESELIENSVNGMFKHVKFKMFETCLNGNIEPACEATFNGVPYSGLSTGQQIFIGIDIINVLAEHYKINAPLFVDRAESFTMPMEATCQTIQLKAVKGLKKLTIELDRVLESAK
ncbi:MAG: hypothetical protein WC356_03640 [Candidatus Micrarchaeia archaeon]|jgi:DNA repair exonuclease SbcCD ATPase subunit